MRAMVLLLILVGGCGPLSTPMVERLETETQAHLNSAWENMMSPPDRLERTLLLDTLISLQAHQRGVDRLDLVSHKQVGAGVAIMTVRYDRLHPEFDEFTIAFIDGKGCEQRRERYSSTEILERIHFLYGHDCGHSEAERASETHRERRASVEARLAEIKAATQPAQ